MLDVCFHARRGAGGTGKRHKKGPCLLPYRHGRGYAERSPASTPLTIPQYTDRVKQVSGHADWQTNGARGENRGGACVRGGCGPPPHGCPQVSSAASARGPARPRLEAGGFQDGSRTRHRLGVSARRETVHSSGPLCTLSHQGGVLAEASARGLRRRAKPQPEAQPAAKRRFETEGVAPHHVLRTFSSTPSPPKTSVARPAVGTASQWSACCSGGP